MTSWAVYLCVLKGNLFYWHKHGIIHMLATCTFLGFSHSYICSIQDCSIFFGSLHLCKTNNFRVCKWSSGMSDCSSSSGVSFVLKVCGSVFDGRNVFVLIWTTAPPSPSTRLRRTLGRRNWFLSVLTLQNLNRELCFVCLWVQTGPWWKRGRCIWLWTLWLVPSVLSSDVWRPLWLECTLASDHLTWIQQVFGRRIDLSVQRKTSQSLVSSTQDLCI